MPDMMILAVPLHRSMFEALQQLAEQTGLSAQDIAAEAITAAISLPNWVNFDALIADLEAQSAPLEPLHITDEDLVAMKQSLLPADAAQLLLGEDLIRRLTGFSPDVPPTQEESVRLWAVATVCEVLKGTRSEEGIRRWWIKPRYSLDGRAPADFLGVRWTPQTLAFRLVVDLAESDAGFSAT